MTFSGKPAPSDVRDSRRRDGWRRQPAGPDAAPGAVAGPEAPHGRRPGKGAADHQQRQQQGLHAQHHPAHCRAAAAGDNDQAENETARGCQ